MSVQSNSISNSDSKDELNSSQSEDVETLGSSVWWDKYYHQSHHQYWDWYLQNSLVIQIIKRALKGEFSIQNSNQDHGKTYNENELDKSEVKLLQTGCGSSELSIQLYNQGYKNIENIDFSEPVIESMKLLHPSDKYPGLQYKQMDARSLDYPENYFNLILDKGTLDCVVLDKLDNYGGFKYLTQVYRCLQIGGVFLCFSLFPYHERIPYFEMDTESVDTKNTASNNKIMKFNTLDWKIIYKALDASPLELPKQQHTHCYICIKKPPITTTTNTVDHNNTASSSVD